MWQKQETVTESSAFIGSHVVVVVFFTTKTNLLVSPLSNTHHEEKHPGEAEALQKNDHCKGDYRGEWRTPTKDMQNFFCSQGPHLLKGL